MFKELLYEVLIYSENVYLLLYIYAELYHTCEWMLFKSTKVAKI